MVIPGKEKKHDENNVVNNFGFGVYLSYWNEKKKYTNSVTPKYKTLKMELTQNKIHKLTDKQYYDTRRKKVLNKRARYNLCYSDFSQESDYENKKGTIIHFDNIPLTKHLRERIPYYFGEKTTNLQGEGNYYYDLNKCGIGFHGDTERRIVIGMRLGESMPLHFQWYKKAVQIGERVKLQLNHGDIYIMSKKAVGFDWKKRKNNILTLRHAAGAKKFLYT